MINVHGRLEGVEMATFYIKLESEVIILCFSISKIALKNFTKNPNNAQPFSCW